MTARQLILIGALLWAGAFILSAILLRGRAVGSWIEGILMVGWVLFVSIWSSRPGQARS